jgi:hypothetical protein
VSRFSVRVPALTVDGSNGSRKRLAVIVRQQQHPNGAAIALPSTTVMMPI